MNKYPWYKDEGYKRKLVSIGVINQPGSNGLPVFLWTEAVRYITERVEEINI